MPEQTWTCLVCHTTVTKPRGQTLPPPQYCSQACFRQRYQTPGLAVRVPWRKYVFTLAMDAALIQASREGFGALKALWRRDPRFTAIPYPNLKRRAQALGMPKGAALVPWSPQEKQLLEAYAGRGYALETWQRLLKRHGFTRSRGAIREKLWHLGWSSRQGQWTLQEVADGLGVDHHVVARWVDKGWLRLSSTGDGPDRPVRWTSTVHLKRLFSVRPHLAAIGQVDVCWLVSLLVDRSAAQALKDPAQTDDDTYAPIGNIYASELLA